jgi:MarR family transcriptional regulator, lower aerobic nicotinate degradation pathway regulator
MSTSPRRSRAAAIKTQDLGIVDSLVQLSFLVQGVLGSVAARYDLSIIQTRLLGVLRDREPGMLELSNFLGLEKSSVTGLIDRAERRGLVRRVASSQDGRGIHVQLTDEGRKLASAFVDDVTRRVMTLTDCLSNADRRRLSTLASQILFADATERGHDLRVRP